MPRPNSRDGTSKDAEQFERVQLAEDRDARRARRADIDEASARALVADLVEADVVVPVPADRTLVHDPTRSVFESVVQLAVFHRGWLAGRDDGSEAE